MLSTKGVSSLLSQAAVQGDLSALLKSPLSYVLIVVLVSTALIQIAFLNRALQRFDARSGMCGPVSAQSRALGTS